MASRIIVVALYVLMIIVVGLIGLRRTKSFKDFFLGGGKVGAWMTAFSYGTAYFSAVLFIGFAGSIGWEFGFSGLWIALFNALVGVFLVWSVFGWRIKRVTSEMGVTTMSEFLEKRYGSPLFKLLSALVIFIFMIPYSAAVFMGLSYLFTTTFGIPFLYALIFMGALTSIYLVMGGYKSMAMIDMVFGMIMVASVIILFFSTLREAGGLMSIAADLSAINPELTSAVGPPGFWALFSFVCLTSVAPIAMPQLVQKFYAIRDRRAVRIGIIGSTFFAILVCGVAYFIGSTTRIFFSPEATPGVFEEGGTPIVDRLMPELLVNVIPEALTVVILLLILSASMSTLAALVLVSSSSFAKDFFAGFVRKDVSDKTLTRLMRFMSGFFVLLSVILALMDIDTIVIILGISWGAIGSFFLGPFVWGLFTKWSTRFGALSSGILGLATCLVLYFCGVPSPQAGTIGMFVSLIINPVFSLISRKTGLA